MNEFKPEPERDELPVPPMPVEKNWKTTDDFEAATEKLRERHGPGSKLGEFYEESINQLMCHLHDWRVNALYDLIPGDCWRAFEAFYRANSKSKKPKPMPFEQWGLYTELVNELSHTAETASLVINKAGDESKGFEQKHELVYGRLVISTFQFTFLPTGETIDLKAIGKSLWLPPSKLPPTLYNMFGDAVGDPTAVKQVGNAWVSFANCDRNVLIKAVHHFEGHLYPPQACKLRFLAVNKAGDGVREVAPEDQPNLPVWVLGKLPQE